MKTRAKIFRKRSSTQKVFRTNLHAYMYIYTTTWNKYTSTKNTDCSFHLLSHPAYLESPASTGRPLWWRSYHFSRRKSISKSSRPYLIVSSFRPRNWIRCFLRTRTVFKQDIILIISWFKSFIGIRLLCLSSECRIRINAVKANNRFSNVSIDSDHLSWRVFGTAQREFVHSRSWVKWPWCTWVIR